MDFIGRCHKNFKVGEGKSQRQGSELSTGEEGDTMSSAGEGLRWDRAAADDE